MHRDLGVIDEPIVLFGGPYSNLQATEALFSAMADLGYAEAKAICTGDVVAYCGQPVETVALIRASGVEVVAGNCEKQLATGAPDCGCGFDEGSTCDILSIGWYRVASSKVTAEDCAWMASCPDIISFRHQGARYAVIHGGFSDIARFLWPTSPMQYFVDEWSLIERAIGPIDHVIAGHCGIPFEIQTPKGRWTNPGVIGMPPHDGAQHSRYAVLDGGEVSFKRLSYDVDAAYEAMLQAGLTQGYHDSLRSGYWPSEDVLPSELRVPSFAKG